MDERTSADLRAQRNKLTADYDAAQVTPSGGGDSVGRVGGSDDESFARPDGAEARGLVAAGEEPAQDDEPDEAREGRDEPLDQSHGPGRGDATGLSDDAPITTEPFGGE